MPAYGPFIDHLAQKRVDLDTDVLKGILLTSSYTPNLTAHDFQNDLTNEVANGNGYTTGGATLAGVAWTLTAANSWGTSRANSTLYAAETVVRPATGNGYLYMATTGGTSGGSIPTYPTVIGQTVTDGSVVWTCVGRAVYILDCNDPSWPGATFTARYMAVVDTTPGTAATNPLIGLLDFGSDITATGGPFNVTVPALGILAFFV